MPFLAPPSLIVPAMFTMPGGTEWLIILVIALLLFGKRLPEIMRGLGSSVRSFKKGMDTDAEPIEREAPKAVEGSVSRSSPLAAPSPEDNKPAPPSPQSQPQNQPPNHY